LIFAAKYLLVMGQSKVGIVIEIPRKL